MSAFGSGFNRSTQHLLILPDEEVCVWRGKADMANTPLNPFGDDNWPLRPVDESLNLGSPQEDWPPRAFRFMQAAMAMPAAANYEPPPLPAACEAIRNICAETSPRRLELQGPRRPKIFCPT
jgi:hypothetical protein